jgi:phosphoglycerol transferase MdoB-like AlkP superfamily enzyme
MGIVAFIVVILIARLKPSERMWRRIPIGPYTFALILASLGFIFFRSIRHTLYPDDLEWNVQPTNNLVAPYMRTPAKLGALPAQRKNLILLHLECIELRSLGLFNPDHRELMPFLSSLAANRTIFTNVPMQTNMEYTVASVFSLNSGVPLAGGRATSDAGSTFMCSMVHTIEDFLDQAGYYQIASCTGYCAVWLFYKQHHIIIRHAEKTDEPHVKYLISDLLPSLVHKKPFTLIVHLESSHPFFTVDEECEREVPGLSDVPSRAMRSVQCVDFFTKKLYNRIIELGLDKDSVVLFYGDHQLWMDPDWYGTGTRPLLLMLPFMDKGAINKSITWYDIAPSIMKLLGFDDYEPRFPFGQDFLGSNVGEIPSDGDRGFIENTCLA